MLLALLHPFLSSRPSVALGLLSLRNSALLRTLPLLQSIHGAPSTERIRRKSLLCAHTAFFQISLARLKLPHRVVLLTLSHPFHLISRFLPLRKRLLASSFTLAEPSFPVDARSRTIVSTLTSVKTSVSSFGTTFPEATEDTTERSSPGANRAHLSCTGRANRSSRFARSSRSDRSPPLALVRVS